jgi:hypothetical protein
MLLVDFFALAIHGYAKKLDTPRYHTVADYHTGMISAVHVCAFRGEYF